MPNAVTLYSALRERVRAFFGPTIAGALIVTLGFGWAFTIDGISYIAVIGALWMMRTDELRIVPPPERRKGQIREGVRYVRDHPDLRLTFLVLAVIGTLS